MFESGPGVNPTSHILDHSEHSLVLTTVGQNEANPFHPCKTFQVNLPMQPKSYEETSGGGA